jgi:ketosteroid isomerase-like protein
MHPARRDSGGGETMAKQDLTVATLKQILAAFNRHDLDGIMAFFAEDCVLEMPRGPHPWGDRFEGKEQVREALTSRFEGLPDVHYSDDRHWVIGDFGVSEWTVTGTTLAGGHIDARGCDHFTFRAGKIVKKDSFWKIVER